MKRILFAWAGLAFITILFAFTEPIKGSCISFDRGPGNNLPVQDTLVPVKVELEKTSINDMFVLFIPDTAKTNESIKEVFGKDYGELMQFIQQSKLQPLKFMAWYYSTQAPWLMDVGVETNQMPSQLSGRIQSRKQKGGEVVIAHMWGPYDQLGQAYIQIENWLKQNNRKASSPSFEVYVNDPSTVNDASEIQTDIYQPIE